MAWALDRKREVAEKSGEDAFGGQLPPIRTPNRPLLSLHDDKVASQEITLLATRW